MDNIEIKEVGLNEISQLQEIGRQTFFETFSSYNTEENMKKYLDQGFSLDKLTIELTDTHSKFYFASADDKVIGYLKINFGQAQTELKDNSALEIERIYVVKAFQGKKAGQLLFEKAIQTAREAKAAYVWLGVWEENLKAISFYKKNGFVEFGQHVFKLGDEEQLDIMMKLQLAS